MRALAPALAALLSATLAACGGEGLPTEAPRAAAAPAASYALTFGAGTPDASAALVRLTGAGIDSVTALAGVELAEVGRDADGVRVVLHGTLDAGPVATVWLRPGAARPVLAIEQVSDARTYALGDPAALGATLVAR
jgi:hypothetical protein